MWHAVAQQVEAGAVPPRPIPLEALKARHLNEAVAAADRHHQVRSWFRALTQCNSRGARAQRSH
jgi:hypothetical protein